tara:strand:- start:890 stop:1543 length:654 start_codon:yes stop_codon:yes gene_type:complete
MKYVETGIPAFRIDESELLYMRLGTWAVSFEGYAYHDGLDITWNRLGPSRNKEQWYGANLGLTEQCDFNSNDWHSPRYDFDGYGHYFDDSCGDYPFHPNSKNYWQRADKYMLWEAHAWKHRNPDNWWSAKAIMEEEVWKQLTNPYNYLVERWNGETTPLDIIKAQELTKDDLHLETIHLYKEFDSKEEKNEAIKEYHINNLVKEIERIDAIPYGKGI